MTDDPDKVLNLAKIQVDPYSAAKDTHAIVICTEWDEFIVRSIHHNFYICVKRSH